MLGKIDLGTDYCFCSGHSHKVLDGCLEGCSCFD